MVFSSALTVVGSPEAYKIRWCTGLTLLRTFDPTNLLRTFLTGFNEMSSRRITNFYTPSEAAVPPFAYSLDVLPGGRVSSHEFLVSDLLMCAIA